MSTPTPAAMRAAKKINEEWRPLTEDARTIDRETGLPELIEALKDLDRAYVSLLESGKERIESLGGECDSMPQMEASCHALLKARAALAKASA